MSLNPTEQMVFDHLESHPEERQFWVGKVHSGAAASGGDLLAAAGALERELWNYFEERSRSERSFMQLAARQGLKRTSMRNLAELLLRLWGPLPKPKRPTS